MARAIHLVRPTLVLATVLAAASAASAGGGVGETVRRPSNSFSLLYTAAAPNSDVRPDSAGAGIAPKAVVRNPYNVPLIQNAGTFGAR